MIITSPDAADRQPSELVTVKLCVPVASPDRVVLLPLPLIVPGLIVQLPAGKPLKITDPVASAQVGCVMVPTVGAEGVAGCALMITSPDAADRQPSEFVTVKLCVPAASPDIVVLLPLPVIVPGLIVQLPEGNPRSSNFDNDGFYRHAYFS